MNQVTADRYYRSGIAASRANDYPFAVQQLARAHINVKLGNLGPAAEATVLYEYAIISGFAGKTAQADRSFQQVLSLIPQARGEVDRLLSPTLAEYARFLQDQGQHRKAAPIFQQAVHALEKDQADKSDPIAFANFLDRAARSLRIAGHSTASQTLKKRANSLRRAHPGKKASFTPKRYPRA